MSTTHSTPEGTDHYAVVGGTTLETHRRCTLVVLHRGRPYNRRPYLEALSQMDLPVMVVEGQRDSYTIEGLAKEFPKVRFLLMADVTNRGAAINAAADETGTPYLLVMWSDQTLKSSLDRTLQSAKETAALVSVPVLRSERGETLPTMLAPAMHRRNLKVLSMPPARGASTTLFPFDYVALYDRARLLEVGGFDPAIHNPFWQKMDFGFRAHLRGETVRLDKGFRVEYRAAHPTEDQTADRDYSRFYAKNLAIRVGKDGVSLPAMQLLPLAIRSGIGLFTGIQLYLETRRWLKENKDQYSVDPRDLVRAWDVEED